MDLKEYKKALDNLPEATIVKYFNNDNSKYIQAKSQMMGIVKKTNENIPLSNQPVFTSYLIRNLLFLCKNRPDFVGSILNGLTINKTSAFAGLMGAAATIPGIIPDFVSISKSKSKSLLEETHNKLNKIKYSSKILQKDIKEVIELIKPISNAKHSSKNVLQVYYMMYLELRASLQLLLHVEDINTTFDFNMSLVDNEVPFIDILKHTDFNLEQYSKNPLVAKMLDDLKVLYNKIEQSNHAQKSYDLPVNSGEGSLKISDSKIRITMNPLLGKKSNNEIILNNQYYTKIQNSPFDLLYYFLWLHKNYPKRKAVLKINDTIPSSHIKEITDGDKTLNRFDYAWNNKFNSRMRNEKSKTVSKINSLLRTHFGINFDIIFEDGEYYKLTKYIKPDNIELTSFQ